MKSYGTPVVCVTNADNDTETHENPKNVRFGKK